MNPPSPRTKSTRLYKGPRSNRRFRFGHTHEGGLNERPRRTEADELRGAGKPAVGRPEPRTFNYRAQPGPRGGKAECPAAPITGHRRSLSGRTDALHLFFSPLIYPPTSAQTTFCGKCLRAVKIFSAKFVLYGKFQKSTHGHTAHPARRTNQAHLVRGAPTVPGARGAAQGAVWGHYRGGKKKL